MTKLRALRRCLADLTERFTLWLSALLAWPFWTPFLLFGSLLALTFGRSDAVMVILTVQTSIDAQATKTLQAHFRTQDEKRDRLLQETVEASAAMLVEVRRMQDVLLDMAEAAERRDKFNAKSLKMALTAFESRADLYDFLMKGGMRSDDKPRETARTARRSGKAHGRPNRKRP